MPAPAQSDIAAAEHDQVLRQPIEFERLDMGKRRRRCEPGNAGIVACVPTLIATRSRSERAGRRRSGLFR
jgi:hypothetical protein